MISSSSSYNSYNEDIVGAYHLGTGRRFRKLAVIKPQTLMHDLHLFLRPFEFIIRNVQIWGKSIVNCVILEAPVRFGARISAVLFLRSKLIYLHKFFS